MLADVTQGVMDSRLLTVLVLGGKFRTLESITNAPSPTVKV